KENENLKEAVKKLDNLSEDEKMQRIADLRQKAIMDEKAIYEKGLEIGIEKGMKEGMKEGIQRGIEKGIEKGIMEGSQKEKIEIAKKMLELKIDKETIAKATGLTEQEIEKILD
ncbi:MAG: ATPase, partial [Clostridia bacterium]|nr:ATPase [Clostridia bacterium]